MLIRTLQTSVLPKSASFATGAGRFKISSISFSGAGFLGAYHTGVYACLLKHGYLLRPQETIQDDDTIKHPHLPILTGVSAGSLISAAISAGVTPDDAMNVVTQITETTQQKTHGMLDVLTPGFSLIDQVEKPLLIEMQKALGGSASPNDCDFDLFLNRTRNGQLLRIGLTDKRKWSAGNVKQDLESYVYADQYRNIMDVVSVCILSSYIPLATGPLSAKDPKNMAIKRAWDIAKEMESLGFLKHGVTSHPVASVERQGDEGAETKERLDETENIAGDDELYYWDGGLCNMFPEIDQKTVIVTPVNGSYSNPSITPLLGYGSTDYDHNDSLSSSMLETVIQQLRKTKLLTRNNTEVKVSEGVRVGVNVENLETLYRMARSSATDILDERFQSGYDDASRFLKENCLETVFTG